MLSSADQARQAELETVASQLAALVAGETDPIALMATIACELYHGVATYDWVGFYRCVEPGLLKIGPYQGGHGCLVIPFDRGVCGRCAATGQIQLVPNVAADPAHIACSATTRSELVLPVYDRQGELRAVLDIDSDTPANFGPVDVEMLAEAMRIFAR